MPFRISSATNYTAEAADNLAARRVRTQVQVLRHIGVAIVVIVTIAFHADDVSQYPPLGRESLRLGWLGCRGCRPRSPHYLSSLLAGVQIALTQPIRLDDVVIVEGEWG